MFLFFLVRKLPLFAVSSGILMRFVSVGANRRLDTGIKCALFAIAAMMLASCDISPGVEQDKVNEEEASKYITDEQFAPEITDIRPFDFCQVRIGGVNTSSCKTDVADKTIFSSGVIRLLLTFSKPVHYDEPVLGDMKFDNAKFFKQEAAYSEFAPVELVVTTSFTGEQTKEFAIVESPSATKAYTYFSFDSTGYIKPINDGKFTVIVSGDKFYAINSNGRKIYGKGKSVQYTYDNTPPQPEISFSIVGMNTPNNTMASTAYDASDDSVNKSKTRLDYGKLKMFIAWEEEVRLLVDTKTLQLGIKDLFIFSCEGCTGAAPYNRGGIIDGNGNGVKFLGVNSAKTIYSFELVETNITDGKLDKLNGASSVEFQLNSGTFVDLAGNATSHDLRHGVKVDSKEPEITSIQYTVIGAETPAVELNGGQGILAVNDIIRFTVNYDEPVTPFDDNFQLGFQLALEKPKDITKPSNASAARLTDNEKALIGQYKKTWTVEYKIDKSDGNNKVNSSIRPVSSPGPDIPGDQYVFDLTTDDWSSDIGNTLEIPVKGQTEMTDRVGLAAKAYESWELKKDTADELNNLHVDAVSPELEIGYIDNFSKLLSGDVSGDLSSDPMKIKPPSITNNIINGQKFAIVLPFTEPLKTNTYEGGIIFGEPNLKDLAAKISVNFCINVRATNLSDCVPPSTSSAVLEYDQALTIQARELSASDPSTDKEVKEVVEKYQQYKYRSLVFSMKIDHKYHGIKKVLLEDPEIPGEPMSAYSDLAGNGFDSDKITATGLILGKESMEININGGKYTVYSFDLVDDAEGAVAKIETNRTYNNQSPILYIKASFNGEFDGTRGAPMGDDATLVLSILDVTGDEKKISSVGVVSSKKEKSNSSVVFKFDLGKYKLEDYDGITVDRLDIKKGSEAKFYNQIRLAPIVGKIIDQGIVSSLIAEKIFVDTVAAECYEAFITNSASGNKVNPPIKFGTRSFSGGYTKDIYLAINCTQQIIFNDYTPDTSLRPLVPANFGDKRVVLEYHSASSNNNILFQLPVQPAMKGEGKIKVGVYGTNAINWYFINGERKGSGTDDHQFFLDRGGNSIDLKRISLTNPTDPTKGFLIEEKLYSEDEISSAKDGIIVNTRLYPQIVVWPKVSDYDDPANYYTDDSGVTYVAGAEGHNQFRFSIAYNRDPTRDGIILHKPSVFALTGDLLADDGKVVGSFVPLEVDDNTVDYIAKLKYGELRGVEVSRLAAKFRVYSSDVSIASAARVPYSEEVFKQTDHDNGDSTETKVPIPISRYLFDSSFGTIDRNADQLNKIVFNTARPKLLSVKLYYNGAAVKADSKAVASYGTFYAALNFDKKMSEAGLTNSMLDIRVRKTDGKLESLRKDDVAFLPRDGTEINKAPTGTSFRNLIGESNYIFYKYTFQSSDYTGDELQINSNPNRAIVTDKSGDTTLPLKDIYYNVFDQSNDTPFVYKIKMAAISEVTNLSFDKALYRHGDTMFIDITTKQRLTTNGLDPKLLALKLRLKENENDVRSTPIEILARGVKLQNFDGYSTIRFSYSLTGRGSQFDSDAPEGLGVQVTGNILKCSTITSTSCPDTWGVKNSTGSTAILSLTDILNNKKVGGTHKSSRVNSVLTRFVVPSGKGDLWGRVVSKLEYTPSSETNKKSVSFSEPLGVDDKLYLSISPNFQDLSPDTINYEKTNSLIGTTKSSLRFKIYNAIASKADWVEAPFDSLSSSKRQLVFVYTVKKGDLVHPRNNSLEIVDYTKDTELSFWVSGSQPFNGLNGILLKGDKDNNTMQDKLYKNPVYGRIVDSDNSDIAGDLTLSSAYLNIDTRPKIVSLVADKPGNFSKGDKVKFSVNFDNSISVQGLFTPSPGIRIDAYATIGGNQSEVTADYFNSSSRQITFDFTVPTGRQGNVRITRIKAVGGASIRFLEGRKATNMLANLSMPINNQLAGVNIDNEQPTVNSAALTSLPGGYGVGSGVINKEIKIRLGLTKALKETPPDGALTLYFKVNKSDGSEGDMLIPYTPVGSNTKTLNFSVNVADLSNDIEDYNGIKLDALRVKSGVTVVTTSGVSISTNMDLSSDTDPSKTVRKEIDSFDIDIDTQPPYIKTIEFLRNDPDNLKNLFSGFDASCDAPNGCFGANKQVDIRATYSEKVTFRNSTGSNYKIRLKRDGDAILEARAIIEGSSTKQRTDKTTDYRLNTGDGYVDTNGIIVDEIVIDANSSIRDGVGNDLLVGSAFLNSLTTDLTIDEIQLDTIAPKITAGSFVAGSYGLNSIIDLNFTFSEDIVASKDLNASIRVDFLGRSNALYNDENFAFQSTAGNIAKFGFKVINKFGGDILESAKFKSPLILTKGKLTDIYGNQTVITFDLGNVADTNVQVNPSFTASITSIKVFNGNREMTTDINNPDPPFKYNDELKIEITWDNTVDLVNYSSDKDKKVFIRLRYPDSNKDTFSNAQNFTPDNFPTKTLTFLTRIESGDEALNGVVVHSLAGINVGGFNKLERNGKPVDTKILGRFNNDLVLGDGKTPGQDNILETVRVSADAPKVPTQATFVNAKGFDTSKGTVDLIMDLSNDTKTVKYIVQLYNGTKLLTSKLPSNVYDPTKNIIYAMPVAGERNRVNIEVSSDIVASCAAISATVKAVDDFNKASTSAVSTTDDSSKNGFAVVRFNAVEPSLPSSIKSASGTSATTFDSLAGFPVMTAPNDQKSKCGTDAKVLFKITYQDVNNKAVSVIPNPSNNTSEYADITKYDELAKENKQYLVALREYTTTFVAKDDSGLLSSPSSYKWTAYTKHLNLRYDASAITSNLGSQVATWVNIGTAKVTNQAGTTITDKSSTSLTAISAGTDRGYTNKAPELKSIGGKKAVVFPASDTNRYNLRFDLDSNTPANRKYIAADHNITLFAVVTLPGLGVNAGDKISAGINSNDKNRIQLGFFLGSNSYTGDNSYENLEIMDKAGFYGLFNPVWLSGVSLDSVAGQYLARNDAEFNAGTRQILVYQLQYDSVSGNYSLCRYVGLRHIDDKSTCANQYNLSLKSWHSKGIDKLYLGAAATAKNDKSAVKLIGTNAHNLAYHELGIYSTTDSLDDATLQRIISGLADKWDVALQPPNNNLGQQMKLVFNNQEADFRAQRVSGTTLSVKAINPFNTSNVFNFNPDLTCYAGSNSAGEIKFPDFTITNMPDLDDKQAAKVHLLLEQSIAGDKAGAINHMRLFNLPYPTTSSNASLIGTNNGTGSFSLTFDGGASFTPSSPDINFTGLCNQYDNEYRLAVYVTKDEISQADLPDLNTGMIMASFEKDYSDKILYKTSKTVAVTYTLDNIEKPTHAYSLRRVLNDYTGDAITIQHSTDDLGLYPSKLVGTIDKEGKKRTTINRDIPKSPMHDISFLSNGRLDIASIQAFADKSADRNVRATILHDQSGNNRDLIHHGWVYGSLYISLSDGTKSRVYLQGSKKLPGLIISTIGGYSSGFFASYTRLKLNQLNIFSVGGVQWDHISKTSPNYDERYIYITNNGYTKTCGTISFKPEYIFYAGFELDEKKVFDKKTNRYIATRKPWGKDGRNALMRYQYKGYNQSACNAEYDVFFDQTGDYSIDITSDRSEGMNKTVLVGGQTILMKIKTSYVDETDDSSGKTKSRVLATQIIRTNDDEFINDTSMDFIPHQPPESTQQIRIGDQFTGVIQEVLFFDKDKPITMKRIEEYINTYYGIY